MKVDTPSDYTYGVRPSNIMPGEYWWTVWRTISGSSVANGYSATDSAAHQDAEWAIAWHKVHGFD